MKFIVDTQLPPRLVTYLTDKGFDSVHTTSFNQGHLLNDSEIMAISVNQKPTVITKDSDFSEHFMLRGAPPKVLLLEFGNIGKSELIDLFDQFFTEVIDAFDEGSGLVIFSRKEVIGY